MEKEIQDLAWACLPKEARTYVREMHKTADQEYKFHKGKRYALEMTYGKSNLESHIEPEEMLIVPRKAVMERYHDLKHPSDAGYNQTLRNANILLLHDLFGDKCLPDTPNMVKSPQLNEPMEEKELNLCELLKGCPRGESLFSISQGAVKLISGQSTCEGYPIQIYCDGSNDVFLRTADGKVQKEGLVDLYPSEGLLKKYPFNPEGAWSEWASERKPKRWRAKCCERYWKINSMGIPVNVQDVYCHNGIDQLRYNFGNYFRTEEEAQQAAEAVRETLMKFHEAHGNQS